MKLYENAGKNIMKLAKILGLILFWGGIGVGSISFFVLLGYEFEFGYAFLLALCIVAGGLLGWLCTLPLYGFGQMVDQLNDIHSGEEVPAEEIPSL